MEVSLTWLVFDWMGTIAFAVSGALVGLSKKMDIFGIVVLALATAVGGGMVRDVLAGITPPVALVSTTDFLIALATAILVAFVYELCPAREAERHKEVASLIYNTFDTLGLASFTVTGVLTGISTPAGDPFILPILLGVMTAVGGGMIRDLLAQRLPVVLWQEVYATAALVGALSICMMMRFLHLNIETAAWLGFVVVALLRFLAVRFHWHLFRPEAGRAFGFKRSGKHH